MRPGLELRGHLLHGQTEALGDVRLVDARVVEALEALLCELQAVVRLDGERDAFSDLLVRGGPLVAHDGLSARCRYDLLAKLAEVRLAHRLKLLGPLRELISRLRKLSRKLVQKVERRLSSPRTVTKRLERGRQLLVDLGDLCDVLAELCDVLAQLGQDLDPLFRCLELEQLTEHRLLFLRLFRLLTNDLDLELDIVQLLGGLFRRVADPVFEDQLEF